jgi:hypothetical protein
MKRVSVLNPKGMGLVEMILWAGFIGIIGWAAWQLYLHPESFQSKPAAHSSYEDTKPSN